MDGWLKKSHVNGNKSTADDAEAEVKTNAYRVFVFCTHWIPVHCYFFFNDYLPQTHNSQFLLF